jgi:hypothetical protein
MFLELKYNHAYFTEEIICTHFVEFVINVDHIIDIFCREYKNISQNLTIFNIALDYGAKKEELNFQNKIERDNFFKMLTTKIGCIVVE